MADSSLIAWIGTAVTAATTLTGATIYVTRSLLQAKIDRQEGEIKSLTDRHSKQIEELTARNTEQIRTLTDRCAELDAKYREALACGNVLAQMKQDVDREFGVLADRIAATAGSIFVAAPSHVVGEKPAQLVFFSSLGDSGAALRRQRIPIATTDAGRAFATEKPQLSGRETAATSFSRNTDRAVGFQTRAKLSIPLFRGQLCVGVAQFLNKQGPSGEFSDGDLDAIVRNRDMLGARLGEITRDPENLLKFGITPSENASTGTVMFADMSNSSELARQVETAQFVDMLNQYFEALGEVALRFGGTIDQFLGDGFMVTFNARREIDNNETKSVQAALEMQKAFAELKRRWVALSYPGASTIFNRIALGTGQMRKAEMGHPQCKQVTVIGTIVNDTHRLCQIANRTRDVIVLDEIIRGKLRGDAPVEPLDGFDNRGVFELKFAALPPSWSAA